MNEEKIREEALLSDEEIYSLKASDPILDMSFVDDYMGEARELLKAQLDKVLKDKRVRIEADNQDLPEYIIADRIVREAQQDMLTPKDGCVWVKCKVKEE